MKLGKCQLCEAMLDPLQESAMECRKAMDLIDD